ncbi:GntR family transcriptional regulator [Victivallis sp. Marseille-Q1083]|uniref:GntR family transcriptional regulator n=1 Tax=Victivallis sp. Marseille-Q1083 TaxID=2717288 RepID=UPI00158B44B9|nr:GntR family transcriptional regulator [Victivallis sp. Marseille-Q1083]
MTILNEAKTRYEIVTEKLKSEVLALPPAGKLPPIRSLMERFCVSQATLDRSLSRLCKQGVLERISGRGYFRSVNAVNKPLRIDFCFFLKKDEISNPLYSMITNFLLQEMYRRNCFTNILAYGDFDGLSGFRELIMHNNPDTLILLGCTNVTFLHLLRAQGLPFLQLYPNCLEESAAAYIIDNHDAMRQIVGHLFQLGHRRIALLHGQGYDGWQMLDQQERIDSYYAAMLANNLPVSGHLVRFGGFAPQSGYQAAYKLLLPRHSRPTAIIGNDYNAPGIYQAAAKLGLKIPEDLSVVGFDGLPQSQLLHPCLTTIDIRWQDTMRRIADHAIQMARSGMQDSDIFRTEVVLTPGSSTGPAPTDTQLKQQ